MGGIVVPILESADPDDWGSHLFGLRRERWDALAGRVFWITGGGTGYGRALACALGAAGAKVALSGRRADKLLESADEICDFAPDAKPLILPLDVTESQACRDAVERIVSAWGRLDGLVCCAALSGNPGSILDMDESKLRRMFEVNVLGQALPCRAAIGPILRQGFGRILLLSSGAGWGFAPEVGVYNATKSAVNAMGASLAAEVCKKAPEADIQVNVINPGEALTEMNRGSVISPFAVCSMAMTLLSHPSGGPNGRFFHRGGRHLGFGDVPPWPHPLD